MKNNLIDLKIISPKIVLLNNLLQNCNKIIIFFFEIKIN